MKRRTLILLLLTALSSSCAMAQINCALGSADSSKLVCQIPFSAGLLNNFSALGSNGTTTPSAGAAATLFNSAIATQVSQLPLASASAGTVLVYKNGVLETFNNLGPILADRASTIGKGKVFIGFTGSQFVFTDINGKSLSSLPFSFFSNAYNSGGTLLSTTYTAESAKLNFRVEQFVGVVTVGVSKRIDLSVIVPVERISMGATSVNSTSYVVSAGGTLLFSQANPNVYASGTASGVGDIAGNLKAIIWTGERDTVSGGLTVRAPTGDDLNLLGSGAFGFNPYLIYSHLGRVSTHAKIGYQWNTTTELNNPTAKAGGNKALPGGLQFDAGADWAAKKWLTLAADILGNQYLNAPAIVTSTTTIAGLTTPVPTSSTQNSSYSISNLSTGFKVNPVGNLVISANLLTQLNNNGLRSRPTPLVGISYKF